MTRITDDLAAAHGTTSATRRETLRESPTAKARVREGEVERELDWQNGKRAREEAARVEEVRGRRAEEKHPRLRDRARFEADAERAGHDLLFFFNDTATTEIYTLSLHDALPI